MYQWVASIRAACGTLSRMPKDLMDSITVTGRLENKRSELELIVELSHELARKNGLQASVEVEAETFIARFSRPAVD